MAEHEETLLKEYSEYPGDITWVDRMYDPHFMSPPPDEKPRRLRDVGRWLKEHVLAAIIIFVLTTILGIYIRLLLPPPNQDQNRQTIQDTRAMRL